MHSHLVGSYLYINIGTFEWIFLLWKLLFLSFTSNIIRCTLLLYWRTQLCFTIDMYVLWFYELCLWVWVLWMCVIYTELGGFSQLLPLWVNDVLHMQWCMDLENSEESSNTAACREAEWFFFLFKLTFVPGCRMFN